MSAYICNPEHIGLLAAYAAEPIPGRCCDTNVIRQWRSGGNEADAARVAEELLKENIRSVRNRYPSGTLPGPSLSEDDQALAAAAYARHYLAERKTLEALKPVDMLGIIRSFEYQAEETDDYHGTLAAQQIRWIRDKAIKALPGSDGAPWGWSETHLLPAVEALYATYNIED